MSKKIPLDEQFLDRKPGVLQNRAKHLKGKLQDQNGALVVEEVAKLCRHVAGVVLKTQQMRIPLVRSYDAAVPIFSPTSRIARQISASQGLSGTPPKGKKGK